MGVPVSALWRFHGETASWQHWTPPSPDGLRCRAQHSLKEGGGHRRGFSSVNGGSVEGAGRSCSIGPLHCVFDGEDRTEQVEGGELRLNGCA